MFCPKKSFENTHKKNADKFYPSLRFSTTHKTNKNCPRSSERCFLNSCFVLIVEILTIRTKTKRFFNMLQVRIQHVYFTIGRLFDSLFECKYTKNLYCIHILSVFFRVIFFAVFATYKKHYCQYFAILKKHFL